MGSDCIFLLSTNLYIRIFQILEVRLNTLPKQFIRGRGKFITRLLYFRDTFTLLELCSCFNVFLSSLIQIQCVFGFILRFGARIVVPFLLFNTSSPPTEFLFTITDMILRKTSSEHKNDTVKNINLTLKEF